VGAPAFLKNADTDHDHRVTPQEAIAGTVTEAVMSRNYYWDSYT
jgi:hypothetical protein